MIILYSKYCICCQWLMDSIRKKKFRMSNGKSLRPNFSPNKKTNNNRSTGKTKKSIFKNFSRDKLIGTKQFK